MLQEAKDEFEAVQQGVKLRKDLESECTCDIERIGPTNW